MFNRLLVPLDGSPLAERALAYAEVLAQRTGARLLLVRGVHDPVEADSEEVAADAQAVAAAEAYLAAQAERLEARHIPTETVVRGVGGHLAAPDLAAWILKESRRRRADVIVMSSHGHSGLGRSVYGSVAEAVLARASLTLLLVNAWMTDGGPASIGDRPRLLLPLDGSAFAEQVLPVATALAGALSGELVVVRAVPHPEWVLGPDRLVAGYLEDEQRELEREARAYVSELAARLRAQGYAVQTEVRVGDPESVIDAVGREQAAALVIMTTHGHTGLVRLILGSVTAKVVRRSTVPILLVRPHVPPG